MGVIMGVIMGKWENGKMGKWGYYYRIPTCWLTNPEGTLQGGGWSLEGGTFAMLHNGTRLVTKAGNQAQNTLFPGGPRN